MDFQELHELYTEVISREDKTKINEFKIKFPNLFKEMELLKNGSRKEFCKLYHAVKVLEQEKEMLEKILKPYHYNITKGFDVPPMDKYEIKLEEINDALKLLKTNS